MKKNPHELTDFHDLILLYVPMRWVPNKSLQEAVELRAVAPLSSALLTAQFSCRHRSKILAPWWEFGKEEKRKEKPTIMPELSLSFFMGTKTQQTEVGKSKIGVKETTNQGKMWLIYITWDD